MSPSSRSKSKDKRAAVKEPQKSSGKPTSSASGVPVGGYNPLLGTFHALETAPVSSAPPIHVNSRSRNMDDTDDHSGTGVEYDSLSNNGSWSGESEDHKEKTSQGSSRQEPIPGVDNDKREKIRQKNEKKHQRQKERRALELHERCSGYLMSRKLESLSQQLVAMGFSSERATMALILNEGRVEQSVAWLFEGGEDADNQREHNNLDGGGNLKIDISEELAQIADMEIKFRCSKQEVERAVVACEGDLDQAAETLKAQKQEPSAAPPPPPPKHEETSEFPTVGNGKHPLAASQNPSATRAQPKHKPDDRDFNYTKMGVTVGPSSSEPGVKNLQLLKKIQPNSEWTKQPQAATPSVEKRWPVGGSSPSVSYSLAAPPPPPPAKTESRYPTIGNELKNLQLGSLREPVIVMQRPKSKHIPTSVSSSSSSSHVDWHPNVIEPVPNMNPNGFSHMSTRSFNTPSYGSSMNTQLYDQFHYQQPHYVSSNGPVDHHFGQQGAMNQLNSNGMWNRMVGGGTTTAAATPTLAAAASLGLFSGSSGPPSPVDWNAGDTLQFDYTNIDWSLDRIPSRPNGLWNGGSGGGSGGRSGMGIVSNGNVRPDGVGGGGSEASAGEWTSPFEEKELFSFPRQFVSSPSL